MIHKCKGSNDPILNNQINKLINLTRILSRNSFENNESAGFVWDAWEGELNSADETIRELYTKSLDDGDCSLYLALVDGHLSGFLLSRQFDEVMTIAMLCVDEEYRKRGIGKELLTTVIKEAKKLKCATISVTTELNNPDAISLYKSCGLIPFSIELGLNL